MKETRRLSDVKCKEFVLDIKIWIVIFVRRGLLYRHLTEPERLIRQKAMIAKNQMMLNNTPCFLKYSEIKKDENLQLIEKAAAELEEKIINRLKKEYWTLSVKAAKKSTPKIKAIVRKPKIKV